MKRNIRIASIIMAMLLLFSCVGMAVLPTAAWAEGAEGAAADGHSGSGGENEADGSKIESIHIHWVTPDTRDDGEEDHLWLSTTSTSELTMQYQIDVSFSGQYDYDEGAIRIYIPRQVWHKRVEGTSTGEMPTRCTGR